MSLNEIFRAALHISSFLSIMKSDFRLGCEMLSLTSMILGDLLLIESHLSDKVICLITARRNTPWHYIGL